MSAFALRSARPDDCEALLALINALAGAVEDPPARLSVEELRRDGFGPDPWFDALVAEAAETPQGGSDLIGYAITQRAWSSDQGGRGCYLADLYVAESWRKKGVARALMAEAARRTKATGATWLGWDVWVENSGAYRFYEGLGARHASDISIMLLEGAALDRLAAEGE